MAIQHRLLCNFLFKRMQIGDMGYVSTDAVSAWIASLQRDKGNSFSISLSKGDRTYNVEFRARLWKSDQLVIDNQRRSALRLPGSVNNHDFVLGTNSEQFRLSFFVAPVRLDISAIELTVDGERIL
jgi:hypothetical protein